MAEVPNHSPHDVGLTDDGDDVALDRCDFARGHVHPPRVAGGVTVHDAREHHLVLIPLLEGDQAATDFNVDLKYTSPETTDPNEQAKLVTDAAGAKPAAMVVTIPDPATLTAPIKQATASGLPVVVMNVGVSLLGQVGALTYVGQDETLAGQEAGTAMAQAGVTHGLCVIHEEQNTALTDRCDGFSKQLTASGGTVQVLHVNGAQLHDAQQAVENALQAGPVDQRRAGYRHPRLQRGGRRAAGHERVRQGEARVVRRLDART